MELTGSLYQSPGHRGAHEYSFADTGLDLEKERLRYADYQQYFDVPSEVV